MILNTPNPLTLSKHMTDCYNSLQAEREFPSDTTLPHITKLAQLGDQTHRMLESENSDKLDVDNCRGRMHLKFLQSQLKVLETEGRLLTNNNGKQSLV